MNSVVTDRHRGTGELRRQDLSEIRLRLMVQQRRLLRPEAQPRLLLPPDQAMVVHAARAGVHDGGLVGLTKNPVVGPERGADQADTAFADQADATVAER